MHSFDGGERKSYHTCVARKAIQIVDELKKRHILKSDDKFITLFCAEKPERTKYGFIADIIYGKVGDKIIEREVFDNYKVRRIMFSQGKFPNSLFENHFRLIIDLTPRTFNNNDYLKVDVDNKISLEGLNKYIENHKIIFGHDENEYIKKYNK